MIQFEDCWCAYDGSEIGSTLGGSGSGSGDGVNVNDLDECLAVSSYFCYHCH